MGSRCRSQLSKAGSLKSGQAHSVCRGRISALEIKPASAPTSHREQGPRIEELVGSLFVSCMWALLLPLPELSKVQGIMNMEVLVLSANLEPSLAV